MGNLGIPFDFCMVEDCERVINNYKAAVFTAPYSSEMGENAKKIWKNKNLPYIGTSPEKPYLTSDELYSFLAASGVHCYNCEGNVIYCANGYLGVHSVFDGIVKISLPKKYLVRPLFTNNFTEYETDEFEFYMNKYETAIFELL